MKKVILCVLTSCLLAGVGSARSYTITADLAHPGGRFIRDIYGNVLAGYYFVWTAAGQVPVVNDPYNILHFTYNGAGAVISVEIN